MQYESTAVTIEGEIVPYLFDPNERPDGPQRRDPKCLHAPWYLTDEVYGGIADALEAVAAGERTSRQQP